MKKMKLSYKAAVSLALSVILFCMPAIAFSMNGSYAMDAMAEEQTEDGTEGVQTPSNAEKKEGTEENEESGASAPDKEDGNGEGEAGDGTVSGNDAPEPVCTCESRCSAYETDHACAVCDKDYKLCAYQTPKVSITIKKPNGWYNDKTVVSFTVKDIADTGNFAVAKVQAKIGQNGSWSDVTEDMELEISENCTVYVQVTDQKGNTYEKSRSIRCFDTTRPTLNAAVSDGLLSIQTHDTDSGVEAVYVNGYEFTELTNGTLNIRLQQFDSGYEYFTISAMDRAGNMSEVYKTKNPYYKDPADESDGNPAEQLPASAQPTNPGSATATVTEHTKTDGNGNTVSQKNPAEQKKAAMAEADAEEQKKDSSKEDKSSTEQSEQGKEFYTIQTASEKVFYLIIDRDGEEEVVYFLTEITENDLLNVTADNSETLPKNSAALESAIPVAEGALSNNNTGQPPEPEQAGGTEETAEGEGGDTEEPEPEPEIKKEPNPLVSYILLGIAAIAAIGGGYYFKVARKKKEGFLDEDDEEDEEAEDEIYDEEEDSEGSPDEDFFDDEDGE